MRVLHFVIPDTVGDRRRPSGGNVYDEQLAVALRGLGQVVREHRVSSSWGFDDRRDELAALLHALPDGATVLVDGLIGLGSAEVLEVHQLRLRLWLLVHLPLGLAGGDKAAERRALGAVSGVITTSEWTRSWLLDCYGPLPVFVAQPGVHAAEIARGSAHGGSLACVATVVPAKGQDVLLDALRELADLDWSCRLVGPLDRDAAYVARVRKQARSLGDRVTITGPLTSGYVYRNADLLVLPTRLEMYGMVVTEALAHGVPVVASRTGGVAEALGRTADGTLPGVLVPPGDASALARTLRRWLEDAELRALLRVAAQERRPQLPDWSETAYTVLRATALLTESSGR